MIEVRTVRRFRDLLEPLAACVYFAPEVHEAFQAVGFGPPNRGPGAITGPNGEAYFTSRGACMGDVAGEVVAAAFGVFDPAVVVPSVTAGRAIAERDAVLSARESGTVAFLERAVEVPAADAARLTELLERGVAATEVAGRPLSAGLRSLGRPASAMGALWRAADIVREHRGDGHVIAWTAAGLDGAEVMLLTELWWGLPRRSYALSRGWPDARYDAADERLAAEGWVADDRLTEAGRALRRSIEATTDHLERGVLAALGPDLDEAIALLEPVTRAILDAGGYPPNAFQTASDVSG